MNGAPPARRPKSAYSETGVRIKEVSEGRPCDNCPELCPGFSWHPWRKTCKQCGCDRLQHAVYHEELESVRARLGLRDTGTTGAHPAYEWAPPGLTAKQTELYWSALTERTPNVPGASGAAAWRAWRTRALARQLPKHDLTINQCRHVDDAHRKDYEDFVTARNEIALDIGVASQYNGSPIECLGCDKTIKAGNIVVQAPLIGDEAYYHPSCFACSECKELLVELAYCTLDGLLYCGRHYGDRLKPRCHSCDEAMECINHIMAGMLPDTEPDFRDLVEHYSKLLNKASNPTSNVPNWIAEGGQGYLCLTENEEGKLKSAAVKYYEGSQPDSAAILFSTKISSFGQDSVESKKYNVNGDYNSSESTERYPTNTKTTKTLISNTSESFSIGQRNRSITPSYENVSDPSHFSENSFEPNKSRNESEKHSTHPQTEQGDKAYDDRHDRSESKEKLTWHYRPLSPSPQLLPEIHFHSSDETDDKGEPALSEDFLRSLDGIKYRPLQRTDPSGRRRSFKKRHSSSSTSSRESRASREEELKMFTSLEEAEFELTSKNEVPVYGSSPNLAARSISRSRSRENSKERRNENWSMDATDSIDDERSTELKPRLKDLPTLGSFEEEKVEEPREQQQVTAASEEVDDFWGNSGD